MTMHTKSRQTATAAFCSGPHLAGSARKLGVGKRQTLVFRPSQVSGLEGHMCYLLTNHLGASPPPSAEYLEESVWVGAIMLLTHDQWQHQQKHAAPSTTLSPSA